jgi:DNA-binding CsgD family transcriptional regulator
MFLAISQLTQLTPAEVEVARLAGAGAKNAQIARMRHVSTHTVAKQMSSVLGKLGVRSRAALATVPELSTGDIPHVDWRSLTTTERRILTRARSGRPQKEIAFECGLAPSTVSRAMNSARRRLGFDSVATLLRACATEGSPAPSQAFVAQGTAHMGELAATVTRVPEM